MLRPDQDPPSGTITFLFSDIEGSTELTQRLDTGTYRDLLEQHHRLLRAAFSAHGGFDRGTQGDAFLAVQSCTDVPHTYDGLVWLYDCTDELTWEGALVIAVR